MKLRSVELFVSSRFGSGVETFNLEARFVEMLNFIDDDSLENYWHFPYKLPPHMRLRGFTLNFSFVFNFKMINSQRSFIGCIKLWPTDKQKLPSEAFYSLIYLKALSIDIDE